MALFKKSVKTEEVETKVNPIKSEKAESVLVKTNYVIRPHITEKSIRGEEHGQYVFSVLKNATKKQVKQEIEKLHKVNVVAVNMIRQEKKSTGFRGKGLRFIVSKKAVVTLKKGDKIDSGVK